MMRLHALSSAVTPTKHDIETTELLQRTMRLPPELRAEIWDYAFHGKHHVALANSGLSSLRTDAEHNHGTTSRIVTVTLLDERRLETAMPPAVAHLSQESRAAGVFHQQAILGSLSPVPPFRSFGHPGFWRSSVHVLRVEYWGRKYTSKTVGATDQFQGLFAKTQEASLAAQMIKDALTLGTVITVDLRSLANLLQWEQPTHRQMFTSKPLPGATEYSEAEEFLRMIAKASHGQVMISDPSTEASFYISSRDWLETGDKVAWVRPSSFNPQGSLQFSVDMEDYAMIRHIYSLEDAPPIQPHEDSRLPRGHVEKVLRSRDRAKQAIQELVEAVNKRLKREKKPMLPLLPKIRLLMDLSFHFYYLPERQEEIDSTLR